MVVYICGHSQWYQRSENEGNSQFATTVNNDP
jgi:hypothetical protein